MDLLIEYFAKGLVTMLMIAMPCVLTAAAVGLVVGINTKKQTGGAKGTGGFVCGLLGLIFGLIFAVGCAACGGCSTCGGGYGNYGCYGCVGASCKAQSDINRATSELEDLFGSLDWDDLY